MTGGIGLESYRRNDYPATVTQVTRAREIARIAKAGKEERRSGLVFRFFPNTPQSVVGELVSLIVVEIGVQIFG